MNVILILMLFQTRAITGKQMNIVVAEQVSIQETPVVEAVEEFHVDLSCSDDATETDDKAATAKESQRTHANDKSVTPAEVDKTEIPQQVVHKVESTDEEVKEILQVAGNTETNNFTEKENEVIMSKPFTESIKPRIEFRSVPEEFYNTLFYFSGMGNVIGTALAEGVYVPEHTAKRAPSPEAVEEIMKSQKIPNRGEEIVKSARTQAIDVSLELKHLQSLLGALPIYSDGTETVSASHKTPTVEKDIKAYTQITDELDRPRALPPRRPVQDNTIMPQNTNTNLVNSTPFAPAALKSAPVLPPQPQYFHKDATINATHPIAKVSLPRFIPLAPKCIPSVPKYSIPTQKLSPTASPAQSVKKYVPPPRITENEYSFIKPHKTYGVYSQPPMPVQHHVAAKLTVNSASTARPYGVATGKFEKPGNTIPWQQRYGNKVVQEKKHPADFAITPTNKSICGTGLKSWQKSHIRAVEARGVYTYVDGPSFDQVHANTEIMSEEISSLAPFLTSKKTFSGDRGSFHQNVFPVASTFQPVPSISANGDLPYCDL